MEKRGSVLMQKYEFGRLLGQGNFAKVYHARDLRTGDNVAIKVIDKEKVIKVGLMDQIKQEISIMRLIKHPNVLQLYEVLATKTKIYFIIEYAKGGELFNKVAKGKLHEDTARKYFQQLISAVDFCHSRGVYHRDLKPENLLLDEHGVLKVADFGLSALVESHCGGNRMLQTVCGTPAYVSPEVISRKGYDGAKADLWSCGVILYVLLAGHLPFFDMNLMALYKKIGRGEYKCPNWFSFEVRRLLARILDPNPVTRISTAKVMQSSWFKKGFISKSADKIKTEVTNNVASLDSDEVVGLCDENQGAANEANQALVNPSFLNAFDIISLSAGLDLSGLFAASSDEQEYVKFTSMSSASSIMSTMEDIARILRMKMTKKDKGLLRLERSREGRKGPIAIDAEIFEFTPSFHLVEIKKSCGDALEYQKILNEDIRPALKDIVWVWQGEQQ